MIKPIHTLPPPPWMRDPDLIRLLDILNHDGINARMVGGCVRNLFYGRPIGDIDLACALSAENTMELCRNAGIKIIPTGLRHGTVTAHMNGKNVEITTLRRDTQTDGRHAVVEQTDNWAADAARRDFTINALYADRDGSIYDPLGLGFADIQNHIVRFIGQAEERIQEDYLRILRFFRFYGEYHDGDADDQSLQACIKFKDNIHNLSRERIEAELFKILSATNAGRAIGLMAGADILGLNDHNAKNLSALVTLQTQLQQENSTARFYISGMDKAMISHKKMIKFFDDLDKFQTDWNRNIKHALHQFDRDVVIQGLLIHKAKGADIDDITLSDAINRPAPVFPVIASDIMHNLKLDPGPKVGEAMKQAEEIWINSNFTLKREEILARL